MCRRGEAVRCLAYPSAVLTGRKNVWAGILEAAGGFFPHHLSDDTAAYGCHSSIRGQHTCTEVLKMPFKPGSSSAGLFPHRMTRGGSRSSVLDGRGARGRRGTEVVEHSARRLAISVGLGPVG